MTEGIEKTPEKQLPTLEEVGDNLARLRAEADKLLEVEEMVVKGEEAATREPEAAKDTERAAAVAAEAEEPAVRQAEAESGAQAAAEAGETAGAGAEEREDEAVLGTGKDEEAFRHESPREMAEAAEGVERGVLVSLGNRLWKRIPAVKISKENFRAPEFFKTISDKKVFGDLTVGRALAALSIGSAGGVAARITRYGLGVATGGAGYGIAMAGGAVSGATAEGIRTYMRERKREISRDEFVERAREYTKKEEEHQLYQESEGIPEFLKNSDKRRAERAANTRARLGRYLELTETETPEESTVEKNELYRELKKEFGVRRMQVVRGCLKGAIIGAIGGAMGEALVNYFGLREAGETAGALKGTGKAAQGEIIGEALRQKMEAASREAHAKAFEKAVGNSIAGLEGRDFTEVAGRGEGLTHIARKAIADYIAQQKALRSPQDFETFKEALHIDKAQLVFAEDFIRKRVLGGEAVLQVGDTFRVKGEDIYNALGAASNLTKEQVDNLNAHWVGKISEKTWGAILDHSLLYNSGNNFAGSAISQAEVQAVEAARAEAAKFAAHAAREAGRHAAAASADAGRSWLYVKAALLGASAAVGGFFLYKKRESLGKFASEIGERMRERFARAKSETEEIEEDEDITEVPERPSRFAAFLERRRRRKTEREEGEPSGREKEGENEEARRRAEEDREGEPAGERVEKDTDRKQQELLRALERRRIPIDLRSSSVEEEKEKLQTDPFIRLVESKGITVDRAMTDYRIPNVEDMGKDSGIREINFSAYTDYRAYLEQMTPEQFSWAQRIGYYGDNVPKELKGKSTMNVWATFWDEVDALPDDAKNKVYDSFVKAREGLLADVFRVKPEINDALLQGLQEEFNRRYSSICGIMLGASGPRVSALHAYNGMKKLTDVFERFGSRLDFGGEAVIRIGERSICNRLDYGSFKYGLFKWEILIDSSLSEDQMREHLIEAATQIRESRSLP